jgi:hypothetical protein
MPVAAARKIEFLNQRDGLDLDIQLRPVVLTYEQVRRCRLPRTPVKDSVSLKAEFEGRVGEGAVELDALEALHPGTLTRILTAEVGRYYDAGLDDEVEVVADQVRDALDEVHAEVIERHEEEAAAIRTDFATLVGEINAEFGVLRERYEARFTEIRERFDELQNTVAADLRNAAPDVGDNEWPEPADGDEDDDPLFDSTRDYVDQIDHYKEHQDRPTEGKRRAGANGGGGGA